MSQPDKSAKKPGKRQPGAPSALVGKINYLQDVLNGLPDSLPLDPPESTFFFGLDPDDLEESVWKAVNRNLEICFQRHLYADDNFLTIRYRSSKFGDLTQMLKEAVAKTDDNYRSLIETVWIDRILDAAKRAGGRSIRKRVRSSANADLKRTRHSELDIHSSESCNKLTFGRTPEAITISSDDEACDHSVQSAKSSRRSPIGNAHPLDSLPCRNDHGDYVEDVTESLISLGTSAGSVPLPVPQTVSIEGRTQCTPRLDPISVGSQNGTGESLKQPLSLINPTKPGEPAQVEILNRPTIGHIDTHPHSSPVPCCIQPICMPEDRTWTSNHGIVSSTTQAESLMSLATSGGSVPARDAPVHATNVNLHQTTLSFPKLTPEAAAEQSKRLFKNLEESCASSQARMEKVAAAKLARKKELARLRARRFRATRKDEKALVTTGHAVSICPDTSSKLDASSTFSTIDVSRQESGRWKTSRDGSRGGTVQQKHRKTNYYHPFLWHLVQKTASKFFYSAHLTTKALKRDFPILFEQLNKGTFYKWLDTSTVPPRWSQATLYNVEKGRARAGDGRVGLLSRYPNVSQAATKALLGLRKNGVPLSITLARSVLLAIIEEKEPQILSTTFKCSEKFVRTFFSSVLNMTPRRATRAAAHIPNNADELCERAFFRLVNIIKTFEVPPSLLVNMDQTGILYIPGFKQTFETKGSKQVHVIGKDEKRGFTLCVSSAADGQFLPFQQVCSGKTMRSTPDMNAERMVEALALGFHFTVAASEKNPSSHYSTLITMKQYMDRIFKPHYDRVLYENPRLPRNQRAILYLDAYPVHISNAFLDFLRENYPYVLPVFVPANCTGIFQPADVGLQRVIKHVIKQVFLEELVASHRQQLSEGSSLEDIKFSNSVTVLRNASVKAVLHVFEYMNSDRGKEIVKMAWRKCSVRNYNLSYDKLYDPDIRLNALEAYLEKDQVLADEITARKKNPILIGQEVEGERSNDNYDDPNEDDAAVPVSEVIASALKIRIPGRCSRYCAHPHNVKESDTGLASGPALVPSALEEDLYAFNDDGVPWGEGGLPTVE